MSKKIIRMMALSLGLTMSLTACGVTEQVNDDTNNLDDNSVVTLKVWGAEADKALDSTIADVYSGKLTIEDALKAVQTQVKGQIK